MAKTPIDQPFETTGEWFIPDSETQISGVLSWAEKKAYLSLNSTFTPKRGAIRAGDYSSYPAIHGVTNDSHYYSVLNARATNSGFNLGPAGVREAENLFSTLIIKGAHVSTDSLYKNIMVRIPGLEMWLSRSGITMTVQHKTEDQPLAIIYKFEGLPEEVFRIESIQAELGFGIERNSSGNMLTNLHMKTSALLRIEPDQPQTLEWFFKELGKATTLLSFLAGSPMSPDHFEVTLSDDTGTAEVYVALRESGYCTFDKVADFYMLRGDMGVDLSQALVKWFEIYDKIAMPSQLALSVFSSKNLWLHVEFLSLMQALEGFHRATMSGLYTSKEKYEDIRQAISNAIPKHIDSDHKASLKKRIEYGNEVSLRKRMNELVLRLDLPIRKLILGNEKGTVPSEWVDTRNYYTHWDEGSKIDILDGADMHRAGVRMKHLLRALYLDLVGIPQNTIIKSLQNTSNDSQYLSQLNNTHH